MASNRRGGVLFLTINGKSYDIKGEWEITFGGALREGMAGASSVLGFKQTERIPGIKGVILDRSDLPIQEILDLENGNASLGLGNGKVYQLSNCWSAGDLKLDTGEGAIALELQGLTGRVVEPIAA